MSLRVIWTSKFKKDYKLAIKKQYQESTKELVQMSI